MATSKIYDLAVIGAGIYGIQAARTYLEIHPNDNVIVFDTDKAVGGVWSKERVYDGFWTQTALGMLEFSDMPLKDVPEDESYHGFFPASYVAEYLEVYITTRIYAGQSLASRIRFSTRVEKLVKTTEGWDLCGKDSNVDSGAPTTYAARKVVDATGLTSTPSIPSIANRESFKGQIFHHKYFNKHQSSLLESSGCLDIAVIGGAKSAADVAYACAKAGHKVHWIIRRSGSGPAAFVSPKASWPYKNSNESFYTRVTSHFLASWFFDESNTWLGRFLYKTSLGQHLIRSVWRAINRKARRFANYGREDGRKNGFYNLRPDTEIFWQNDSTGICQRPDFFDTIARGVKVYREDIKCMNATGLELADGTFVEADHVVFATGWTTSHPEIVGEDGETDIRPTLGLSVSHPDENLDTASTSHWQDLETSAQEGVLIRFPFLRDQPPHYRHRKTKGTTKLPLRLYKGMLPIQDRSIAFVGQLLSGNNFRISEVQALYAVAALDGTLELPSLVKMETTIARTIAWNMLRYLDKGSFGSWIYWDMVPYTDDLLTELGLRSHRHGSWLQDLFAPCVAADLVGLIGEYKSKLQEPSVNKIEAEVTTSE